MVSVPLQPHYIETTGFISMIYLSFSEVIGIDYFPSNFFSCSSAFSL